MNNFDRISPYRQPTIPTYQNVEMLEDVEFLEKLPKDVLEMIEKGDLDGAMAKLRDNDQENESFMRLFFQLMGEMTTNLWKPFSDGTNKLFSFFRRPESDPLHNKDKVDRPARVEDRRDLKAASSEKLSPEQQKALYIQQEVEKLNKQPVIQKKSLVDNPFVKPLVSQFNKLIDKSDMLCLQMLSLLNLLMLKPLKLLKGMMMDKGALPLLDKGKLFVENIKNIGVAIDQKLVMPLLKMLSAPVLEARTFLESATKEMKGLYETLKQKIVEPIKGKLRVFDPYLEKFESVRNKAMEITRDAGEWLKDRVDAVKNKVKTWTPPLNLKPGFQYIDQRYRDLVDHAQNFKEVVQHHVQTAVQVFQQISHVVLVPMLPMINLFVVVQQTTMRYSLVGIKYINKKIQKELKKFTQKMKEHLQAMQKKIVVAATITLEVSRWFFKTLYQMLIDLFNAVKVVFLRFISLAWKVIKAGGFIFWNILSTLPSALFFLMRKGIKKLKKSVLTALRKKREEATHPKSPS